MTGLTADGELIAGAYRLGELLGVGGTASVYAADYVADSTADRLTGATAGERFAIKVLHPHLCTDEASRAAFLREARQASVLEHPNIVRVHDAGVHDAGGVLMPWIAFDLLDGPTLADWVDATGRLSPADAVAVAEGLLAGLGHAHAADLVHRDLSPSNIILTGLEDRGVGERITADCVRILDFGLSQTTGRTALGGDVLLAHPRQGDDYVVGNAAYMSPEAAQGLPVRSVSDLYQAGAVLYFALTGQAPYPRQSTAQVLRAHVDAPTPVPSVLAPGVRPLDRIVTTAMAKTPARRYRDAAAFAEALREAAATLEAARTSPLTAHTEVIGGGMGGGEPHGAGVNGPEGSAFPGTGSHFAAHPDANDVATRLYPLALEASSPDYLYTLDNDSDADAAFDFDEDAAPSGRSGVRAGTALLVGAIAVTLAAVGVFAAIAVPEPPPAKPPVVTVPTEAPPPPPVEEPPPAQRSVANVPTLHGTLSDAEAALRSVGLTLGTVTRIESASPADTVLSQHPAAGESLPLGGAVAITVASGSNVVPQLTGMTLAAATAQLTSQGFTAMAQPLDADPTAIVTGTQPGAGAIMRLGVTVTLTLAPPPPPTPTPTDPPVDPEPPDPGTADPEGPGTPPRNGTKP